MHNKTKKKIQNKKDVERLKEKEKWFIHRRINREDIETVRREIEERLNRNVA